MIDYDRRFSSTLRRLPARAWLPDPQRVTTRLLADGTYHTSLIVESGGVRIVARICRDSQWGLTPLDQLRREGLVLADLAGTGVVPRPFHLLETDPPVLFESYIPGAPFRYRDLDSVAMALAACHRAAPLRCSSFLVPVRPDVMLLDDGAKRRGRVERRGVTDASELLRFAERALRRRDPVPPEPPSIVHTDLIHGNLLETSGLGCAIVDWEGARLGTPAWDLAYFLSPVTLRWAEAGSELITPERRSDFLRAYAEASGTESDAVSAAVTRILPFVAFRALCWCAEAVAFPPDGRTSSEQLRSFTDPTFMEATLRAVGALDDFP